MRAGTRQAWSRMRQAATPGLATSSATARLLGRSACASVSSARPNHSSSSGRPTSSCSAARRTSGSPDTKRDIGAVGDHSGDPGVGEEACDSGLIVDGPDPGRDAPALAETQHGQPGELLMNRHEVGVAALQPAAWKELAEPDAKLHPGCEPADLLADREACSNTWKLLLDRPDRCVPRGDDELVHRAAVERRVHDLGLVAGLLQIEVETYAPRRDV